MRKKGCNVISGVSILESSRDAVVGDNRSANFQFL